MRIIMMTIFGIIFQLASLFIFDASSAEGYITFLCGLIIGSISYDENFKKKKEAE